MASQVGSKFSGKVALITGASSGIGAATAELFSKMGANLSLTGRNLDNLQKTADRCITVEPEQKKPLLIQGITFTNLFFFLLIIEIATSSADLMSESDTATLVKKTIEAFGQLDILVNNAGVLEMG